MCGVTPRSIGGVCSIGARFGNQDSVIGKEDRKVKKKKNQHKKINKKERDGSSTQEERKKEKRKWLCSVCAYAHTSNTQDSGDDDKANDKRKEEEIDTIYEYKGHNTDIIVELAQRSKDKRME